MAKEASWGTRKAKPDGRAESGEGLHAGGSGRCQCLTCRTKTWATHGPEQGRAEGTKAPAPVAEKREALPVDWEKLWDLAHALEAIAELARVEQRPEDLDRAHSLVGGILDALGTAPRQRAECSRHGAGPAGAPTATACAFCVLELASNYQKEMKAHARAVAALERCEERLSAFEGPVAP